MNKGNFFFYKQNSKKKSNKSTKTVQLGFNYQISEGIFIYSPLGFVLLKNIKKFISKKMRKIGALEILMPSIEKTEKKSNKSNYFEKEIFKIKKNLILTPTHEDVFIRNIINKIKKKEYPKIFFQISNKFRDEIRQKGFLRTSEFIMKDAYSLNLSYKCLKKCYNNIIDLYCKIFNKLKIKYVKIKSTEKEIKNCKYSTEFHFLTKEGDKNLVIDIKNKKIKKLKNNIKKNNNNFKILKSIEIGHCFFIGKQKHQNKNFYFGSYGIGISRLYYIIIKNRLKKKSIFNRIIKIKYIIITTNEKFTKKAKKIYKKMKKISVLDNRKNISFKKKLKDIKNLGFYIILISKKIMEDKLIIINKKNKEKEINKKLFLKKIN